MSWETGNKGNSSRRGAKPGTEIELLVSQGQEKLRQIMPDGGPRSVIHPDAKPVLTSPNLRIHGVPFDDGGAITSPLPLISFATSSEAAQPTGVLCEHERGDRQQPYRRYRRATQTRPGRAVRL